MMRSLLLAPLLLLPRPCVAAPAPAELKAPARWPTAALKFPDGRTITVEVAATPEAREYGLMDRETLPKDYGMLFAFPTEGGLQFWMKHTLVSLDMVFIGKDRRITAVHHKVPKSERDTPDDKVARRGGLAQFVLELPAGDARRHKLQRGQLLDFAVEVPAR